MLRQPKLSMAITFTFVALERCSRIYYSIAIMDRINEVIAQCTFICFNFYRQRSTSSHISSITAQPVVPCGLRILLGTGTAFLLDDVMHVSKIWREAKHCRWESSCSDEVIHTPGWDTYRLTLQVVRQSCRWTRASSTPQTRHTYTHVPKSHILSCQTATKHWQLFGVCL